MLVLPNILFVRRRRKPSGNEESHIEKRVSKESINNNPKQISTKVKLKNDNTVKRNNRKSFKIWKYKIKNENNKNNTHSKNSSTEKCGKKNYPKLLLFKLIWLKCKTQKYLNRFNSILYKRRNSSKNCSNNSKIPQYIDCDNQLHNYEVSNKVFKLDDLSIEDRSSVLEIWKSDWDACYEECLTRSKSVFNVESCRNHFYATDIPSFGSICDWSRDSVFCNSSETIQNFEYFSPDTSKHGSSQSVYESCINLCLKEENFYDCEAPEYIFNILDSDNNKRKGLSEEEYSVKGLVEHGCEFPDLLTRNFSVNDNFNKNIFSDKLIKCDSELELFYDVESENFLNDLDNSFQESTIYEYPHIDHFFKPKDKNLLQLQNRINNGKDLYSSCDVSVWLRTCEKEILEPLSGITTGIIPLWLKGVLLRNGPGSLKVGNEQFQHLFDGSALIHRFGIENGEIRYQCKFIETNTYKRNQAAQRIVVTEFGTAGVPDPCQSIFHRISVLFNAGETMSDNAMISIYPFGDEYYAFAENSVIHQIDPVTLESLQRVNVSKHINIVNHTSHPHVLNDGTVYNLGLSITCTGPQYTIAKFPPPLYEEVNGIRSKMKSSFEQGEIVATVSARWKLNPSYMHTFGITENYFVIVEQPLAVSFTTMLCRHLSNQPMAPSLKWHKNEQTRIHLIDRITGKLTSTYLSDPFFYLHIINQYECEGHLILDISCYKDSSMLDCMYIDALKGAHKNPNYAEMFRGRPLRFVLPLTSPEEYAWGTNMVTLTGSKAAAYKFVDNTVFVCPELICDLGCETPRIFYEKHLGKMYRYFYAISSDVDLDNPGTLIKVDVKNKTTKTWCEENVFPSEPVFVPAPNSKSEDDGVILSALVWTKGMENKVGLLVLDAHSWTELGRTEFTTPSPVPKCLHGWFNGYS